MRGFVLVIGDVGRNVLGMGTRSLLSTIPMDWSHLSYQSIGTTETMSQNWCIEFRAVEVETKKYLIVSHRILRERVWV